ncbi:hypothetical protein SPFL3102_00229 [Sporomusaceae bacterium FL31]|jgi:hypothetical protein|nr:hypothetical protein SPFL3101_01721 [Sporomusaceae bacterium FL31]GCE32451.1 hypothetical protein SPFL3102_00229 [Sporomusaceae bacterium]
MNSKLLENPIIIVTGLIGAYSVFLSIYAILK